MTTLRNRLLFSLILTAALVCTFGVGGASAKARLYSYSDRTTLSTPLYKRPIVSPYSGEPDAGGSGAPKASCTPTTAPTGYTVALPTSASDWVLRIWALWLMRR